MRITRWAKPALKSWAQGNEGTLIEPVSTVNEIFMVKCLIVERLDQYHAPSVNTAAVNAKIDRMLADKAANSSGEYFFDSNPKEECIQDQHLIVTGIPASGKSTIARALSQETGLEMLDKDEILDDLFNERGIGDVHGRTILSRTAD